MTPQRESEKHGDKKMPHFMNIMEKQEEISGCSRPELLKNCLLHSKGGCD